MVDGFLLTPGFSRVWLTSSDLSRFNGFSPVAKPLKRFHLICPTCTGLKPGVNEIASLQEQCLDAPNCKQLAIL